MNIFFLDRDPQKAAQYHCDKHVIKMITESAQLLSTWVSAVDAEAYSAKGFYMPTHINHPCNKWLRERDSNVVWLTNLLGYLIEEYEYRYGKNASKFIKARVIRDILATNVQTDFPISQPPLCMPEEYKLITFTLLDYLDPIVLSYREYYIHGKTHSLKYTKREKPHWL